MPFYISSLCYAEDQSLSSSCPHAQMVTNLYAACIYATFLGWVGVKEGGNPKHLFPLFFYWTLSLRLVILVTYLYRQELLEEQ